MPKLFATNYANVSYDSLEREYETPVVILTSGFIDVSNPAGIKRIWEKIKPILDKSSPEDFLIISGSAPISIIISHFWMKHHGICRMLTFNRRIDGGKYVEVTLPGTSISPDDSST